MTLIGEKVNVMAVFKNGSVMPKKFVWNGKELIVNKIDLNYSKMIGDVVIRLAAVKKGILKPDENGDLKAVMPPESSPAETQEENGP